MDTVFEQVIKSHLDERSHTDELFATKYSNPKKSIKECCDYIDSQARKAAGKENRVRIPDSVVFGWAIHYYDEENIKVSSHPICRASSPVQQQKKKPTSPKEPSLVPVHESSASPKK